MLHAHTGETQGIFSRVPVATWKMSAVCEAHVICNCFRTASTPFVIFPSIFLGPWSRAWWYQESAHPLHSAYLICLSGGCNDTHCLDVLYENPEPSHTGGHWGQQYRHMCPSQAAEGHAARGTARTWTADLSVNTRSFQWLCDRQWGNVRTTEKLMLKNERLKVWFSFFPPADSSKVYMQNTEHQKAQYQF